MLVGWLLYVGLTYATEVSGEAGGRTSSWRWCGVAVRADAVPGVLADADALRPGPRSSTSIAARTSRLANFAKAWRAPKIQESFVNSAVLATLRAIFSLQSPC